MNSLLIIYIIVIILISVKEKNEIRKLKIKTSLLM
jgi:hypothetical protein